MADITEGYRKASILSLTNRHEKLQKELAGISVRPPHDRFYFIHVLFLLLGIVMVMPFVFMVNANGYWMYKFRNISKGEGVDLDNKTPLQAYFVSVVDTAQASTGIIFTFLFTRYGHFIRLRMRLLLSLLFSSICFLLFMIFIEINTDAWQAEFFIISMGIIAINSGVLQAYQTSVMALISKFPISIVKTMTYGQGAAHLLIAILQIISISIGRSQEADALIYFGCGLLVMLLTLFMVFLSRYCVYYRFYLELVVEDTTRRPHTFAQLSETVRRIWPALGLFLLMIIQMAVSHPAITSLVVSEYYNGGSLWAILNFFPVPVEEECNSDDGRRKGVCMNTYECRIKNGKSHGYCALGFGVCCVFTATCQQEALSNITYFVNPDFPDLTSGMSSCSLIVRKLDDEIAQIRLDFIHFNLGQPNRKTGVCEEDIFLMTAGGYTKSLTMCGFNSGQHIYFDVETWNEPIEISMNLSRKAVSRLWEIRVIQVPFTQRAPAGCLQYYEGITGTIQTMNFADNGRHLADQDYSICMRQEDGMCSIAYEPCHENAFRISPNTGAENYPSEEIGSGEETEGREMQSCNDRITVPCDSEDLIMPGDQSELLGYCTVIHCGPTLCPSGDTPCRIESSATPFVVGVHFGASAREESPDDNLGMCLVYEQQPCNA